ncbi:MAG: glycosyltransferase [Candidatus Acidiferrales bacterium]
MPVNPADESREAGTPGAGFASVVIACYNDADIVERNVAALARQSFRDFEAIIADDGSREDYGPMLDHWAPRFAHPIQHVRHEDIGFRKTRILNRAIHVSGCERIIFIDMDCLPHENFVRDHLRYLTPGTAVSGRRVYVKRDAVPPAEEIWTRGLRLGALRLLGLWIRGRAQHIENGLALPFAYQAPDRGILGCNFSAWKSDLLAINGFNAEFAGAGWEDTDLDFRLRLVNVKPKILRYVAVEYHVEHPVRVPSNDPVNEERLNAIRIERIVRAKVGLNEIRADDFIWKRYGPLLKSESS